MAESLREVATIDPAESEWQKPRTVLDDRFTANFQQGKF
jgi:hypothetical protein